MQKSGEEHRYNKQDLKWWKQDWLCSDTSEKECYNSGGDRKKEEGELLQRMDDSMMNKYFIFITNFSNLVSNTRWEPQETKSSDVIFQTPKLEEIEEMSGYTHAT